MTLEVVATWERKSSAVAFNVAFRCNGFFATVHTKITSLAFALRALLTQHFHNFFFYIVFSIYIYCAHRDGRHEERQRSVQVTLYELQLRLYISQLLVFFLSPSSYNFFSDSRLALSLRELGNPRRLRSLSLSLARCGVCTHNSSVRGERKKRVCMEGKKFTTPRRLTLSFAPRKALSLSSILVRLEYLAKKFVWDESERERECTQHRQEVHFHVKKLSLSSMAQLGGSALTPPRTMEKKSEGSACTFFFHGESLTLF